MTGSDAPDAIIVGAGIVGAACAAALSRDGLRVLVLEASSAAFGSTAAGMGHIVVMDDSPEQLALTRYSAVLWAREDGALGRASELDWCGTLWIAEDASQLAAVAAKHHLYGDCGIATELLDERQVAEAEPNLRAGLAGALRVPGDGVLYPPAAATALLRDARDRGARVREHSPVDAIEAGAGGGRGEGRCRVRCGAEVLEADVVVNAAGAAAPRLTPGLPIVPRKGHLVITDRYHGFCRHQLVELGYLTSAHVLTGESVAFNLQPRPTGQVLVGSSRELAGWDPSINRRVVARMLSRACAFTPALADLTAIRTWTGFRPATADKLPLIGRWPDVPGLWIAAGHEGLGITTSLATGAILADLIAGRRPAIDPAPYAPDRTAAVEVH